MTLLTTPLIMQLRINTACSIDGFRMGENWAIFSSDVSNYLRCLVNLAH